MTAQLYPASYIRLDVFPASVRITDSQSGTEEVKHSVRMIITDSHIYIMSDTPEGPAPVYSEPLLSFDGNQKIGYTAVAEDETELYFKRSSSCGCGSRLRGYRPFPGVPYQARF